MFLCTIHSFGTYLPQVVKLVNMRVDQRLMETTVNPIDAKVCEDEKLEDLPTLHSIRVVSGVAGVCPDKKIRRYTNTA